MTEVRLLINIMKIVEIKEYSDEVLKAVNALLPQLSKSAGQLSHKELESIIGSDTSKLLLAIEDGQFFGMLTLVVFRIPTGVRAWIEDVVVGESARGKGVGKLLTEFAVELAISNGAKTIDLTSRPDRDVANSLYKRVGFVQRETNVYRYLPS